MSADREAASDSVRDASGPRSDELAIRLAELEAPGVNTLGGDTPPLAWDEAEGATVVDVDGHRYLDLTSGFGVAAVGHRHPRVVTAVESQSRRLLHGLGDVAPHPVRVELAAALAARAPVPDPRVYFAVSGADAVEIAVKTALLATGRPGLVAFEGAYHGLTMGALAVTDRRFGAAFSPHLSTHVRRLPYGCGPAALEDALADGRIGAVVVEPVLGRGGVVIPPSGWLAGVHRTCRRHETLLVVDEILTGCGRTGPLFACERDGVEPDLLCCGKALGGGMPIAATIGRRELMAGWPTGGPALHTATFLAHPPACAAALAVLEVIEGEGLLERVARLDGEMRAALADRFDAHEAVHAIRGCGAIWGLEMRSPGLAAAWSAAARRRGVLTLCAGRRDEVLQLLPPYTIEWSQLDDSLDRLAGALAEVR